MKILTLTTLYPNEKQPVHAVFVKNRIVALNKLCEVKVVAPVPFAFPFKFFSRQYKLFSEIPSIELQDSMEVSHPRYLIIPKIGRSLYGFMYMLSILGFMIKLKKKYDFDLLDVHWAYPDGFAGLMLAKLFGKPITITVRGSDINEYTKSIIRRKIITYTLKRVNRVISVSQDMGDKVLDLGVPRTKILVISNGVNIDKFHPLDRNQARQKLGLPKDRSIILFVGRLAHPKRLDLIIDAVKKLVKEKQQKEILLIIVGDGEYYNNLKNQVEASNLGEYVRLVGSKLNEDLVYWYNSADVLCLASSSEGCPNVLFESMSCGTPVVASAVGGVPEIIKSEEYGFLTYKQDADELSNVLENALHKNWDREKIIKYAQANTWDRVAEKVYESFQSIMKESH